MILNKQHLLLNDRAVISHFAFRPPLVVSADLEHEACFIFPIRAQGQIFRQDGKKSVGAEEAILMKCGQYLNKWQGTNDADVAEVVIIRLFPEVLDGILETDVQASVQRNLADRRPVGATVVALDELLKKYLDSLIFYFEHPELVTDELVKLKVKELTLLLLNTKGNNPINELLYTLFQPTKYSLQEIVEANLVEDLSIDELAALANMSTPTFKRKFKKLLGESPGQYVRRRRLDLAKLELKHPDKTITEVAYACGFNDPGYFAKIFARATGQTPSQFRKGQKV